MQTFSDICGHEKVIEHMKNAVREKRPAHSYIISGPKYSGKKTLAKAFAAALLCEKGGEEPCMECFSCRHMESDDNPDYIQIKKEKTTVSIEEVREQLVRTVDDPPYKGAFKIYVIDEAETLRQDAQNTLLKTLEEPPEYVVILLLTTEKHLLLPTVQSRCVNLDLHPVDDAKIVSYLMEKHRVVDYQAKQAVSFADGNVGKALRLAQSPDFMQLREDIIDILTRIKDMESADLVAVAKRLSENKLDTDDLFDIMMLWYRDVLLYKATADANAVRFKEQIYDLRRVSEQMGYEDVQNILTTIEKSRKRIAANVNIGIVMELLLFAMKG